MYGFVDIPFACTSRCTGVRGSRGSAGLHGGSRPGCCVRRWSMRTGRTAAPSRCRTARGMMQGAVPAPELDLSQAETEGTAGRGGRCVRCRRRSAVRSRCAAPQPTTISGSGVQPCKFDRGAARESSARRGPVDLRPAGADLAEGTIWPRRVRLTLWSSVVRPTMLACKNE